MNPSNVTGIDTIQSHAQVVADVAMRKLHKRHLAKQAHLLDTKFFVKYMFY